MTLRTDAALERALDILVAEEDSSRQEAIRRAVIEKAERYAKRREIEALSGEAKAEWAKTLDRLGTV